MTADNDDAAVTGSPERLERTESTPEGTAEGAPEGAVEGEPEGMAEGAPEGAAEGAPEGLAGDPAEASESAEFDRSSPDPRRATTEPSRAQRASHGRADVPVALDRALRVVAVLAVLGLGAAGLAQ